MPKLIESSSGRWDGQKRHRDNSAAQLRPPTISAQHSTVSLVVAAARPIMMDVQKNISVPQLRKRRRTNNNPTYIS